MNIANKITIFRFLAIPFFVAVIMHYSPKLDYLRFVALGIFALAVISDGLDGYLARRRKEFTRAGAILDPLADKILLITSLICVYLIKDKFPSHISLPLWFLLLAISRDVLIVIGSASLYMSGNNFEIIPSRLGKLTTFFQMLVVLGVLIQFEYSHFLWYVAAVFTVLSGLGYLHKGQQLISQENSKGV